MFKRSTCLPARPSIPNKDEILDDLRNACSDDVIYELNDQNSSFDKKLPKNVCEDYDFEEIEVKAPTSYLEIDSFLDKINYLKDCLINLQEQKANLKRLEDTLKEDIVRIKKELNSTSQAS